MSDNETKVAVIARLRELDGKNREDVIGFFKERLGKPDEYDDDEDWFYRPEQDKIVPYSSLDDAWGVEYTIFISDYNEYYHTVYKSLQEIQQIIEKMKQKFPEILDEDIKLVSYTWYNGVDEPRYLKR